MGKKYNGAGIYCLFNVVSLRIYIGKSKNINSRFLHHKMNFACKSGTNSMYKLPIDNFVFLVLHKMSDEEYAVYGDLAESIYIAEAIRDGLRLYNINCVEKDITWRVLSAAKSEKHLKDAIYNSTGSKLHWLKAMSKNHRMMIRDKILEERRKDA